MTSHEFGPAMVLGLEREEGVEQQVNGVCSTAQMRVYFPGSRARLMISRKAGRCWAYVISIRMDGPL